MNRSHVDEQAARNSITSRRRVVGNAFFNSAGWGVKVFISLAATPYIVFKLTPEGYGIYALLTGIISYNALLDLGIGAGLTKYVAEYRGQGNYKAINCTIAASLLIYGIIGLISSSLIIAFASSILSSLGIPQQYWDEARTGLYLCSAGILICMVKAAISATLNGLQLYAVTNKVSVGSAAGLHLLTVIVLFLGYGLVHAITLVIISALVSLILYLIFLRRAMPQWRVAVMPRWKYLKAQFNFSGYVCIVNFSGFFYSYIVRIILSALLGPIAVTYYVVPMKIIGALKGMFARMSAVLFPYASELGAREDAVELQRVFMTATKYVVTIGFPLYLVLILFPHQFLSLWMGVEYAESGWMVLRLLAIAYLVALISTVPVNIALGVGHAKAIALRSAISLFVGLGLMVPLTSWGGVNGTALAILVTQIITSLFTGYVAQKVMQINLWMFVKKTLSFHFIVGAVVFVANETIYIYTGNIGMIVAVCSAAALVFSYYCLCIATSWIPYKEMVRVAGGYHSRGKK